MKYAVTGLKGIGENDLTEVNCYPNPFKDEVTIEINLFKDAEVTTEVYNHLGQQVKIIQTKQILPAGLHKLQWDGKNAVNRQLSSGIYHLRIEIDNKPIHRKLVFSK